VEVQGAAFRRAILERGFYIARGTTCPVLANLDGRPSVAVVRKLRLARAGLELTAETDLLVTEPNKNGSPRKDTAVFGVR
jgi:hypothetical protein